MLILVLALAVLDVYRLFLELLLTMQAVGQVQLIILTRHLLVDLVAAALGAMPTQQWVLLQQTEPLIQAVVVAQQVMADQAS
jgi:uncharacterized membrane protein